MPRALAIAVLIGAALLPFHSAIFDTREEQTGTASLSLRCTISDPHEEKTDCRKIIGGTVAYLKDEKVALCERKMRTIARHVYDESERYHIDYRLILALMKVESNFKNDAVSCKGALGLLQIMPSLGKTVAKDLGMKWKGDEQLHEPDKNIRIGVHHLSGLMKDFATLPSALHAYNGGASRARALDAQKQHPTVRFASAVIKEYSKTISVLPEP